MGVFFDDHQTFSHPAPIFRRLMLVGCMCLRTLQDLVQVSWEHQIFVKKSPNNLGNDKESNNVYYVLGCNNMVCKYM